MGQHRRWQELAIEQGTKPIMGDDVPDLFDDDEDLALFLAAAHGRTSAQ
jgi:hypothetical protein